MIQTMENDYSNKFLFKLNQQLETLMSMPLNAQLISDKFLPSLENVDFEISKTIAPEKREEPSVEFSFQFDNIPSASNLENQLVITDFVLEDMRVRNKENCKVKIRKWEQECKNKNNKPKVAFRIQRNRSLTPKVISREASSHTGRRSVDCKLINPLNFYKGVEPGSRLLSMRQNRVRRVENIEDRDEIRFQPINKKNQFKSSRKMRLKASKNLNRIDCMKLLH